MQVTFGSLEKQNGSRRCPNCSENYEKLELVQYYACPKCHGKIGQEQNRASCQHWFGYLNQKEKDEAIPESCPECERVVECMLMNGNSASAVAEIKKWY